MVTVDGCPGDPAAGTPLPISLVTGLSGWRENVSGSVVDIDIDIYIDIYIDIDIDIGIEVEVEVRGNTFRSGRGFRSGTYVTDSGLRSSSNHMPTRARVPPSVAPMVAPEM